jgi:hypothetical protein
MVRCVIDGGLGKFAELRRIGHQPAQIHVISGGINDRKTMFTG